MTKPKKITLALQGGGAHGAFAWGVLDRLVAEPSVEIVGISASGTGAMNAAVFAAAYAQGGKKRAQQMLEVFWHKVSTAASLSPLQPTLFDKAIGNAQLNFSPSFAALDFLTRVFSPYEFNLFDINPFKDILKETVDFKQVQSCKKLSLFISATNVVSGEAHLFTGDEITLETVLASSCLPYIFKTVEVDEQPYWDGGFTSGPALAPLVEKLKSRNVVLVQTSPFVHPDIPTKAPDILDRATEIGFNASLAKEIEMIEWVNRLIEKGSLTDKRYKPVQVHTIEANEIIGSLGRASKLNADWSFLTYMRDIGIQAADDWLTSELKKTKKK